LIDGIDGIDGISFGDYYYLAVCGKVYGSHDQAKMQTVALVYCIVLAY